MTGGGDRSRLSFGRLGAKLRDLAGREGGPLRVFVSYRREAGPGQAHHLATDLERYLGAEHVFLDERAIGAGEDFDAVINARVGGADVLLAVIGPGWVDMQPRLADGHDYVRREIEAALARRVPVICVATPGATMPDVTSLPESLQPMLVRPGLAVDIPSDALWAVAVDSLGQWLLRIRDDKRRHDRELRRAVEARQDAERVLERARERHASATAAAVAAAERRAGLEGELPVAQEELARRRIDAEPTRVGPGIRVFVCHRGEGADEAARLAGDLGARLGAERVHRSLPAAGEAVAPAAEHLSTADALLVLIGPGWLDGVAAAVRGEAADDTHVVREIEAAIARGAAIIPLQTRRAALPSSAALPEQLRPLLAHHALMLPEQFWDAAVQRLVERLNEIERAIARRERAVADAGARCESLERDTARAVQDVAQTRTAATAAAERVSALEAALAAAQERERELSDEPPDANRAYLDGPPAPRELTAR